MVKKLQNVSIKKMKNYRRPRKGPLQEMHHILYERSRRPDLQEKRLNFELRNLPLYNKVDGYRSVRLIGAERISYNAPYNISNPMQNYIITIQITIYASRVMSQVDRGDVIRIQKKTWTQLKKFPHGDLDRTFQELEHYLNAKLLDPENYRMFNDYLIDELQIPTTRYLSRFMQRETDKSRSKRKRGKSRSTRKRRKSKSKQKKT